MPDSISVLFALDDPTARARVLGPGTLTTDVQHAPEAIAAVLPDVVVTDDSTVRSAELCRRLAHHAPGTRVVVLTAGGVTHSWDALCNGAFCVLDQRASTEAIEQAIAGAVRGEATLDARIAGLVRGHLRVIADHDHDPFAPLAKLTAVEDELLCALANGESVDAIAEARGVNARLVGVHVGYAVTKLHQHTLAAYALLAHV